MQGEVVDDWEFRVLIDAQCPLCAREARMLAWLDRGRGRLDLEDLSAPDFDPGRYGLDQATVEARIHGVLPDGRVVEGVEVFVRAYRAVGWGWLAAPATWPGLRRVFAVAYTWFARNRLRLTGRGDAACPVGEAGSRCAPLLQVDESDRLTSTAQESAP